MVYPMILCSRNISKLHPQNIPTITNLEDYVISVSGIEMVNGIVVMTLVKIAFLSEAYMNSNNKQLQIFRVWLKLQLLILKMDAL
ncbi:hypothetical protein D3C73_1330360 [compost metagenome]